jgi:membrane protein implicated in regulation of membrane protease activity
MVLTWMHWVGFGLILMLAELAIGSFFIFWFGLGGLLVGLVVLLFPLLSFTSQLLTWTVASLLFVVLWFKVLKPNTLRTRAGMSKDQFSGEIGLVTRPIRTFEKGLVQFQRPILGDEKWEALADMEIPAGERVRVVEVEGNLIRVQPV